MKNSRIANAFVLALSLSFFVMSGLENGVGPCAFTTFQETFNSTTTETTIGVNMVEVSKVIGSIVYGHLGHSHHKPLFLCLGMIIWVVGALVVAFSQHVAMLGLGYFTMGCGYSATTVLTPSLCNDIANCHELHEGCEKGTTGQKQTLYLSICLAVGALGVASGFVICGLTVSHWRWNFALAPILLVPAFVLMIAAHRAYVRVRATATGEEEVELKSPKQMLAALKGSQAERPPFLLTAKSAACHKTVIFAVLVYTQTSFIIAAFTQLIPKFLEVQLGTSKKTASLVMAASVPAVCFGLYAGGVLCTKLRLSLSGQMLFILLTMTAVVPMVLFLTAQSLAMFIVSFVAAMLVIFLNSAPQLSVLSVAMEAVHAAGLAHPKVSLSALVSFVNGGASFVGRTGGMITGPLVLAAMIDHSEATGSPTFLTCYLIVGFYGVGSGALFALGGWLSAISLQSKAQQRTREDGKAYQPLSPSPPTATGETSDHKEMITLETPPTKVRKSADADINTDGTSSSVPLATPEIAADMI